MRKRTEGYQCSVRGCKKRLKLDKINMDGSQTSAETHDEETLVKKLFPRTFHW